MRRLDGDDRGLGRGGKRGGGKQIAKISREKEDGERAERETGISIISGKVRRRAVMNCGDARRAARDTRTFFTLSRLSHISLSLFFSRASFFPLFLRLYYAKDFYCSYFWRY